MMKWRMELLRIEEPEKEESGFSTMRPDRWELEDPRYLERETRAKNDESRMG